jgi:nicotinate-nucleotide adenylyltransferase
MRLGILGGTFDPIHLGHLRAAEIAREALGLDRVLLVPAALPPHRQASVASPLDRFAMVCLATAGHPGLVPCNAEIRREGPSYTIDTLRDLAAAHPADEFVVLVGSDAYAEMAGWRDVESLRSRWSVAVIARPGDHDLAVPAVGTQTVAGAGLSISSSLVRRLVAEGRSVRYLVPDSVAEYLAKQGLYR